VCVFGTSIRLKRSSNPFSPSFGLVLRFPHDLWCNNIDDVWRRRREFRPVQGISAPPPPHPRNALISWLTHKRVSRCSLLSWWSLHFRFCFVAVRYLCVIYTKFIKWRHNEDISTRLQFLSLKVFNQFRLYLLGFVPTERCRANFYIFSRCSNRNYTLDRAAILT
jgi:hypothetical protein